jgi:hypothetical protein
MSSAKIGQGHAIFAARPHVQNRELHGSHGLVPSASSALAAVDFAHFAPLAISAISIPEGWIGV